MFGTNFKLENGRRISNGAPDASKPADRGSYAIVDEENGHSSTSHGKSHHQINGNISHVPDEILFEIWKYLVFTPDCVSLEWLTITHVCSHWRRIAMSFSLLWSRPCLRCPDAASQLLERAGTSKLNLEITVVELLQLSGHGGNPALELASSILHNAEAIILELPNQNSTAPMHDSDLRRFLARLRSEDATRNLKYLTLSYPRFPSATLLHPDLDPTDIVGKSPQLQHATFLNRNPFDSPSPLTSVPSLTRLWVEMHAAPSHNQSSSTSQVLQVLCCLENLTSLTLFRAFKPLDREDVARYRSPRSPVTLPALCDLQIQASVQASHVFLDSIQYPSTASIYVEGLWDEANGYISGIDSLRGLLETTTYRITSPIRCLLLAPVASDDDWSISFYVANPSGEGLVPQLQLFLPPSIQTHDIAPELPRLCPLNELKTFKYTLPSSTSDIWKSFGSLDNLRCVMLNTKHHPTFLDVFGSLRPSGNTVFNPDRRLLWRPDPLERKDTPYFSHPQFSVRLLADSPKSVWQQREETNKISSARKCWETYSRFAYRP